MGTFSLPAGKQASSALRATGAFQSWWILPNDNRLGGRPETIQSSTGLRGKLRVHHYAGEIGDDQAGLLEVKIGPRDCAAGSYYHPKGAYEGHAEGRLRVDVTTQKTNVGLGFGQGKAQDQVLRHDPGVV